MLGGKLMSKQITPFSISAPGFYGLNLSDSPVGMPSEFALVANNCVIDKSGRISSRKGWSKVNSTSADLGTADVECMGELIGNDGTSTILAAGNLSLFKLSGSTLVKLTYGGGGAAPTITSNNWKFCQLNGIAMFWQRGHDPLIYDPAVSTTTYRRVSEKTGYTGTVPLANTAIGAYGRIWAADTTTDKNTVSWSDTLTTHLWTAGSSGTLNLLGVWPAGGDEIVALAAHNNFLFIFGRKQILVYQGANTPSTMTLQDSIVGIGCIARDSVQATGEDMWFLSDSGVRSLQRTIQEKSIPFRQTSRNVHDDLQGCISNEELTVPSLSTIKAGYSAVNSFYLLTCPTSQKTYCFDTRTTLPDGSAKTTMWLGAPSKCFLETKARKLYMGKPGYLGEYSGYLDDAVTYRMSYYTSWIDFGNPIQASILKRILLTLIGGISQAIVFKWGYDFSDNYFNETGYIVGATNSAQYGIGQYGISEYSNGININVLSVNGSSSGKILQFGFEADISNQNLSIQKIDLFTKDGRL